MKNERITFELTSPIHYTEGSKLVECNHIELLPPTGKVGHIAAAIEGLIQSSLIKMADSLDEATIADAKEKAAQAKKGDEVAEVDGDAMMSTIAASGADVSKVVMHARELFREVALMGGEKPMTVPRLDEMSWKDSRRMIGVYIANFVMG